jgi:hypothetical protein
MSHITLPRVSQLVENTTSKNEDNNTTVINNSMAVSCNNYMDGIALELKQKNRIVAQFYEINKVMNLKTIDNIFFISPVIDIIEAYNASSYICCGQPIIQNMNWLFGTFFDSDIIQPDNIRSITQDMPLENISTVISYKTKSLFNSILLTILNADTGSNAIFYISSPDENMLYLLCYFYSEVKLFKPLLSSIYISEYYILCKDLLAKNFDKKKYFISTTNIIPPIYNIPDTFNKQVSDFIKKYNEPATLECNKPPAAEIINQWKKLYS